MVNAIYGTNDTYESVMDAIAEAGLDPMNLEVEDLAPIDQLHGGELAVTKSLAARVEIAADMTVLDAGCGIAGPARYLAKTFGCRVIAIDMSERFISAAIRLNEFFGLSEQVICRVGDISSTGLEDNTVDIIWCQAVLMNIADKAAAFNEMYRVLRPSGSALIQAVTKGDGHPDYPVMWAAGPEMDFTCPAFELRELAEAAGFKISTWEETDQPPAPGPTVSPVSMTHALVMGFEDNGAAWANTATALATGRLTRTLAVLTKGND